jgi:leishmanolysin-like peptidase
MDRPTFGSINFCPDMLHPDQYDRPQIYTAIHELMHALGFSGASFPLFRNEDGSPKTPRDTTQVYQPANEYAVSTSCGTSFGASAETIQFYAERGMEQCTSIAQGGTGNCVHRVVTPRVQEVSRDHFGCDQLPGAELENQPTTACSAVASHWDQRLFATEIMAPYTSHHSMISAVTLALFEDSGWYKANYSNADMWREGADWGFQQGCEFATEKCIKQDGSGYIGTGYPEHFCTVDQQSSPDMCTTDRRGYGRCNLVSGQSALPQQYQYFADPNLGGYSPAQMDYCPTVSPWSNRICSQPMQNDDQYYGSSYGINSMCMESSSLIRSGYSTSTYSPVGCYAYTCSVQEGEPVLTIELPDYTNPGAIVTADCFNEGDMATFAGYNGQI